MNRELQIWRSPSSTLQERANAVMMLFRKSTAFGDIKKVLGTNGQWVRRYGLRESLENVSSSLIARAQGRYEEWSFDYTVPGGTVMLYFAIPEGRTDWETAEFIRAAAAVNVPVQQ